MVARIKKYSFKLPATVDRVMMAFLRQGKYRNATMFMDGVQGPSCIDVAGEVVAQIHVISTMSVARNSRWLVALYIPGWHANRSEFAVAEYHDGQLVELWSADENNVVFVPNNAEYDERVVKMGAAPAKLGGRIECDWLFLTKQHATQNYSVAVQR